MPFGGHDGKVVVDYGCGPGIELTGLGLYSKPARLYGVDVSASALEKAKRRAGVHGIECTLLHLGQESGAIAIDSESVDHVHCSGVLHHTPDPASILREFRRILKPGATANIMVYHHDSVYMHLYVAYMKMVLRSRYKGLSREEVFRVSTDGPTCPISRAYTADGFLTLARQAGLDGVCTGAAMENGSEMKNLPLRWDAIADPRLDPQSRAFLYELTFDERGRPVYRGRTAGVHVCFQLRRPR
jgi:SAM-dependent methyltransferase